MDDPGWLTLTAFGAPAESALRSALATAKGTDPLAPVTVVCPSTYAALSLRHALGQDGLVNVRFMVLPRVAELLGAPLLAREGKRPLTAVLEKAALRAAAAQADGPLTGVRGHPSLHRSLLTTFQDLRHVSPETCAALAACGTLYAETARLYGLFRERTKGYYDREALAGAGAPAVAAGAAPGLRDLGRVVLYLLRDLTPSETLLIRALARAGACAVILGVTGEFDTDEKTLALARRLVDAPAPITPPVLEGVPTASSIVVAPDAAEEVRLAVRAIVQAARQGAPLHRMALLYRQQTPYAALVREELALAGIPAAGPGAGSLAATAAGRALHGLLSFVESDMPRDEVMGWVAGSPMTTPDPAVRLEPARWDALSRAAGVVKGRDQWQDRLEAFALRLEEQAAEADDEGHDARADRLRRETSAARDLRAFVGRLYLDTRPPEDGASWERLARWATGLLDGYLDARTLATPGHEAEEKARETVVAGLAEMATLDAAQSGPSFAEFRMAVDDLLAAPQGHLGRVGTGVFVGSFEAALGAGFARVFLLGMAEGWVPPRPAQDPLLPDAERQAVGGSAAGFPLAASAMADERYAYLAALASAPRRTLSFPRADTAGQRELHPSRWLLESATRLNGAPVYASALSTLPQAPWLRRVASREDGLTKARTDGFTGPYEYDLHALVRWRAQGLPLHQHHIVTSGDGLRRTLALEAARHSALLTPWDGDLTSAAQDARRLRITGRAVLSASSLEAWAACPFSYFLSRALGLAALETPEEVTSLSALEKGSLVHRVLEDLLKTAQREGTAPGPGAPWSGEHRSLMERLAEQAFADAEARGLTGKRLLWDLQRAEILSDLYAFLEEDARLRARFGTRPLRGEMAFGMDGAAPAAWDIPGLGTLRFRGKVDRVDVDASGKEAVVLDYKTGSAYGYKDLAKDPLARGRKLQLPLYAAAVQAALGEGVRVRAAYWFTSAKGGFALLPPEPVALDTIGERFTETVSVIAGSIHAGLFPANPGDGDANCTYCDFRTLCPQRRGRMWERKQADSRLAAYVALSQGAEEETE